MTNNPENYIWSSYCASIGQCDCPKWLAADNLLGTFHSQSSQRKKAIWLYQQYVVKGIDQPFSGKIMQQSYLGDEAFIDQVQNHISQKQSDSIHITKRSKKSPKKPIEEFISTASDRGDAMKEIYATGHYTMFEIAQYYDVHYSTVSRTIRSLLAKYND